MSPEKSERGVDLRNPAEAFLAEHRPALADGGGLRGDVVRAGGDEDVAVSLRATGERGERGHTLGADELK